MKNVKQAIALVAVLLVLTLTASVRGAEGDAPAPTNRRGGGGSRLTPESIASSLIGELAMTTDQKAKVTESYDKTVKPIREKLTAAADADAKKAIYPELKTASDAFKESLKTILKENQYKVIESMGGGGRTRTAN